MADNKSDSDRSTNMAAIRSRNTRPEILLRKSLWRCGIRFFTADGWKRLSSQPLPGAPDLIFPAARLVVFVDGCFWHGCPQHYTQPADNHDYWQAKVTKNMARDASVTEELKNRGWQVRRIWEHDINTRNIEALVHELRQSIRGPEAASMPTA